MIVFKMKSTFFRDIDSSKYFIFYDYHIAISEIIIEAHNDK